MTNDKAITMSRELAERITNPFGDPHDKFNAVQELRALLAAPVVERQEPVPLTAVAVLRDDGEGALEPEWLLEGGTAELFEGAVLLIADLDQTLCEEDGHCTLYREQPAPVVVARNAERYEYLRGRDLETIRNGGVFAGMTPANVVLNGEDLDAAIDAAMAVKP